MLLIITNFHLKGMKSLMFLRLKTTLTEPISLNQTLHRNGMN